MAGIYLHIPFCRQACHYCDFHFSTNLSYKEKMVEAIVQEALMQKDYLGGEAVETIYFGGGTPSLLSQKELEKLLEVLAKTHSMSNDREITLEANPDDLTPEKLQELKGAGINRLSIGIQTFQDEHLRFMNRAHNSRQALDCVKDAREAGFDNISIDLIYGIPAKDHSLWQQDMATALELKPEHISSYCLTIEPQTTFGNWLRKGKIQQANEEYEAHQFELLLETLGVAGYEQYEISNFSLPGKYSRHNSSYWQQKAYLGLGPSAHSFNRKNRQFNLRHNAHYLKAISEKKVPFELEELDRANLINEYLLTGLRTKWGCNLTYLKQQFQYDLEKEHSGLWQVLQEKQYIRKENDFLVLTNGGKLLADEIASKFMVVDE